MNQILKQLNKIRVPESELEILSHSDGGYMKYGYKNQPFTGYMVMDYHPNGYVMYEEEFKEGEHLGWDNLYYENGQLERETLASARLLTGALSSKHANTKYARFLTIHKLSLVNLSRITFRIKIALF